MAKMSINELAAAIKTDNPDYKDVDNTQLVNAFVSDNPEYKDTVISTPKPTTDEERAKSFGTISEAPNPVLQFGQDVLRKGQVAGQSFLNPILQPIQKLMGATPIKPMGYAEEKISDLAGGVRNFATAELGGGIANKLGGKIIGGLVGGATTGALQPVSEGNELGVAERVKNTAIGAGAGGALGALFKGITAYRNINKVDSVLYPKVDKAIGDAYRTMHKNIETDLKALPEAFPGRTIVTENLYDEVSKYVTADKKALGIIKEIPELKAMLRTKVPVVIKTPFEAQMLKNKITSKLSEAAKNGTISAKEYQSAKIALGIDKDIINAYPEAYPNIKSVYDEASGLLDILEPLRNRAKFKSVLVGGAAKGQGQAMQTALSKVVPADVANEAINYATMIKSSPKITSLFEKNIRPRNVTPALKRVVKVKK